MWSNLENELYGNELYTCILNKTKTDHYTAPLNMYYVIGKIDQTRICMHFPD